jgi:hypothetical protein
MYEKRFSQKFPGKVWISFKSKVQRDISFHIEIDINKIKNRRRKTQKNLLLFFRSVQSC